MTRPKGNETTYILQYEECMEVIQSMRFGNESDLFGKEKDGSFKGSIGNIYQSFDGVDVYESLEEKAANLLLNILVSGNLDSGILETDIPEEGNSLIGLFTTYQVVRYCQAQSRFAVL